MPLALHGGAAPGRRRRAFGWLAGWGFALVLGLAGARPLAAEGHGAWPVVRLNGPQAAPLHLAWEAEGGRLYATQPDLHQVALLGVRSAVPILQPLPGQAGPRRDREDLAAALAQGMEPYEILATPDGRVLLSSPFGQPLPEAMSFLANSSFICEWGPHGLFRTLAGTADPGDEPDLAAWPAGQARFQAPPRLALAADGALLLGEVDRILELKDGMVRPIAGGSHLIPQQGGARPALGASLSMDGMVAGPDGTIYITDMDLHTGRVTMRKLVSQKDGSYSLQTLGPGVAGASSRPAPPTWWPFPRALTVDGDGRVFVLPDDGARIDQLSPGAHGYIHSTLPASRSIENGQPVALSALVAAGDDSFFAIEQGTGTVFFLGPGREGPILDELQGLRALLEGAATQPSSQGSQDDAAPAVSQALEDGITAHLLRIGQLFKAERPSLLPMLDRRERQGRPLPAQAMAALVRNQFRRALVKAALPELGVPQQYLATVDVDALLAGRPAQPSPASASTTRP